MSNKIKKQSLLGKTPQRKKTTQSSTKKTAPVSAHNVAGTGSDINAQDTKPKSRTLIITLVVLVLGHYHYFMFILLPLNLQHPLHAFPSSKNQKLRTCKKSPQRSLRSNVLGAYRIACAPGPIT